MQLFPEPSLKNVKVRKAGEREPSDVRSPRPPELQRQQRFEKTHEQLNASITRNCLKSVMAYQT